MDLIFYFFPTQIIFAVMGILILNQNACLFPENALHELPHFPHHLKGNDKQKPSPSLCVVVGSCLVDVIGMYRVFQTIEKVLAQDFRIAAVNAQTSKHSFLLTTTPEVFD